VNLRSDGHGCDSTSEVIVSKRAFTIEIGETVENLRRSSYHQQLGQKMCAAYIAQQQGIAIETALRKVSDPLGDLWLIIAEVARQGFEHPTPESGKQVTPPPSAVM
jgi:hypothetical protein